MSAGLRELAVVVMGLAALVIGGTAGAARSRPAPSPKPLWQAFPLGERPAPEGTRGRDPRRSTRPVPHPDPTRPRDPVAVVSPRAEESRTRTLTFAVAAALVVAGSAVLVLSLRTAPGGSRRSFRDRTRAAPLGVWFLISVPAAVVLGWLAVHYPP
jgi:hypothetical protein